VVRTEPLPSTEPVVRTEALPSTESVKTERMVKTKPRVKTKPVVKAERAPSVVRTRPTKGRRRRQRRLDALLGVLGTALVVLILLLTIPRGETPDTAPPETQGTPLVPSAAPTGGATPPLAQDLAQIARRGKVKLKITHFCFCSGPRGQLMLKLKAAVENQDDKPINISASTDPNLRLLVIRKMGKWTPPPGTTARMSRARIEDSRPGRVHIDAVRAWLIPPNPDGAFEVFDSVATFATHWPDVVLGPGESYYDPDIKQGDLVFYIPLPPGTERNIVGLVYIQDRRIRGITRSFGEWADPNEF
jgi:hypothetical protein